MTATLPQPDAGAEELSGRPEHLGPARAKKTVVDRLRARMPGLVSLVIFFGGWQLIVSITDPSPLILPGPGLVLDKFLEALEDGSVWSSVQGSAGPLAIGMAISLVAIPIGLLIGLSPTADLLTSPYLWGFFALPNISFAPLLILISGFGTATAIWMVVLSASIPLCLSCKDGVQTVDPGLVRAARSFGGSPTAVFVKVVAPCALPFIASGFRNAISRGFVGLLSVELLIGGASDGIGGEVTASARVFDTARMIAFILLLVVIALVLVAASRRLETWASRWRPEVTI